VEKVFVGGQGCHSIRWVSPSQVECRGVSGAAWPAGANVEVAVAGQYSSLNTLFAPLSYPVVDSVTPVSGVGGERIILTGRNFGRVNEDVKSVSLGPYLCLDILVRSES